MIGSEFDRRQDEEDDQITNLDPDELQMLFEVHTGKYVSIHDFEANLQPADSTTYFDKNMATATTFQTISQRRTSKFTTEPWDTFWDKKLASNEALIKACQEGNLVTATTLLNPLLGLDQTAEVRFTDQNGLGAIHHAILNRHNQLVKTLLKYEEGLITMELEDNSKNTSLHLIAQTGNTALLKLVSDFQADYSA